MRRSRKYRRRRVTRPRRNHRRPGYKIAIEILIVAAIAQGAFFVINSYKKPKPAAVKAGVAMAPVVKPPVAKPKAEEPVKPEIKVAKAKAPKPESKAGPEVKVKPRPEPRIQPKPKEIKPRLKPEKAVKKPAPPVKKAVIPAGSQGRIAIVLDDWGYSLNNIQMADNLNYPFTAAVLPNLRHSKSAAEELHKQGKEVILHLPMESQAKLGMEKDTILTSMDDGQIKDIVGRGLDNVVYARGINNHMGSKATQDPRVMEAVFKELKKRRLYFLDSAVTPESVCPELADRVNIAFIKRDVFLDNRSEHEYIKGQVEKLKSVAKKNGFAVGIGHDRKDTLEVLNEVMPELEEEGYRFVFVSELAH